MAEGKLNKRQQEFLDLYLSGILPNEAYQRVYKCNRSIANTNAYRLLENARIKEAIEQTRKQERQAQEQRLHKMINKSIDNIDEALNLDEDDASLNFFKMMAIQHKTKTAENHLKRMGMDAPEKVNHNIDGELEITFKDAD